MGDGDDEVLLERRDDGVAVLTLHAPGRRNAMGRSMAARLRDEVAALADDETVRAVVVTGAGGAFCAGADLPELFGEVGDDVGDLAADLRRYYEAFLAVRRLPVPAVAAVAGPAIGAGLNLAMACHVRIVGRDAALGATFTRIGLHPGGGCTWMLVRELGRSRALRILLEGAVIDAEQAVAWGLAEDGGDDPLGAALELAGRAAGLEPSLASRLLQAADLAEHAPLEAVVDFEAWAQADSARSERLAAHVARFRR